MKPYFFIPASKVIKLEDIYALGQPEVIVDLEDSVSDEKRIRGLNRLKEEPVRFKNSWVRVKLRSTFDEPLDKTQLVELNELGYSKFVLPKLIDKNELDSVLGSVSNKTQLIILVEHPRLLIELSTALATRNHQLYGLGLGSHDLLGFMGMKHSFANLNLPRQELMFLAKAYDLVAIDIASMNIADAESFGEEVKSGIDMGYDAKFIIHPGQLKVLQMTTSGLNKGALQRAERIISIVEQKNEKDRYEPFVLDGEAIEKPHIEKAEVLIKKNYGK